MHIQRGRTGLWRPQGPVIRNLDSAQSNGLIAWWPVGPTSRDVSPNALLDIVGYHTTTNVGGFHTRVGQMGLTLQNTSAVDTYHEFATTRLSFASQEGTMSYWTKLTNATPASDSLSGFGFYVLPASTVSHYPLSSGLVYCGEMSTDRPINGVSPLASVTRTDWHLVTVVSRAGTNNYRFFQNGQLMAAGTRGGWPSLLATARLFGQFFSGVGNFVVDGFGCDFRIWNRALTDAEVWELYQPSTRWEMYWQSRRAYVSNAIAASAATFPALTIAI
jgi:hypothetical protein